MNHLLRLGVVVVGLSLLAANRANEIRIDPTFPTIEVGSAVQFTALDTVTGAPVNAKWAISDPLVASISSQGLATGRNPGKAVVRAQVKNMKAETTVTVTAPPAPDPDPPPPDPQPSARGPQPTITCPAGAVQISPGASIQAAVNSQPQGATFCLQAGVYAITASITPKSGQTFVGEYGAIMDGSSWMTTDEAAGAFQAVNMNVDDVTIRNLTIRNMPKKGVMVNGESQGWVLEYTDIGPTQWGFVLSANSTVRFSKLHHASIGGYSFYLTRLYPGSLTTFEDNEVYNNAGQTKFQDNGRAIVRRNNYHDQVADSIWFDGDANGTIIEDNLIERSGRIGIHIEMVVNALVRNNVIRGSGDHGIFLSTTRDSFIETNTLEDNFRGVTLYLTCLSLDQGWDWAPDLRNNTIRNNQTRTQSGAIAALFTYSGDCTSERLQPYLTNAKNNWYVGNTYQTANSTGWYWVTPKTFQEWQGLGQDVGGSVSQ